MSSCTGTLFLPKGEKLYTGAKFKLKPAQKNWKVSDLEADLATDIILPRRGKRFLGLRPRVGIYNVFHNPDKEKGFGNWVARKLGRPPVLYQPSIIAQHQKAFKETTAAHGFFSIKIETKEKGLGKRSKLRHKIYLLLPAKVVGKLQYPADSSEVEQRLSQLKTSSLLVPGEPYRFQLLTLERQRLADSLRNEGWFNLSAEHLLFEADTLRRDSLVHLKLRFKDDVTEEQKRRYRIGEIIVYPDHDLKTAGAQGQQMLQIDDCTSFVYSELTLKKKAILDNLRFSCGEYFSNEKYRNTLFRLLNLGYFKFVNIRFEPSVLSDSLLEAHVYLTPQLPMKMEASLSGIFSPENYGGLQTGLTWQHRNLLGSAENLRLSWAGNGLLLNQNQEQNADRNTRQIFTSETRAQLTLPQRIPGLRTRQKNALTATRLSLAHDFYYQDLLQVGEPKIGLTLQRFEGEGGFYWKKNRQGSVTHELNPINAAVQYSTFNESGFKADVLAEIPTDTTNTFLVFATQVELRPNYAFVYDNRLANNPKLASVFRQRFTLRGSGFLLPKAIADAADLGYPLNFFTESDIRQYIRLQPKTTLAYRFSFFSGFVLTDKSSFSPLDLYTIGGPSSVRAFTPRTIGPGTTPLDDPASPGEGLIINDRLGNLQILSSIELRRQLGKNWEVATFFDTGNVWLTKSAGGTESGVFGSDFYQELASGAGVGLRFNLSLFILRLDLAVPVSKPYQPLGSRWIGQPGYGPATLRVNFAFGHPF